MGCRHRITAEYGKHGKERGFVSSLFAFYNIAPLMGFLISDKKRVAMQIQHDFERMIYYG